jgi:hypothetical protein
MGFMHMSRHAWLSLGVVLLGWVAVRALWALLRFDALRSDPAGYWQDSLAWSRPFHLFHVPGYPWLIAGGRALGPGAPPLALMQAIALAALLLGAWLTYRLLLEAHVDDETAAWGALAYGLWPFVGVTYVALPVADATALAWFLAGTLALCRRRTYVAAVLLGAALITHKATWPLVMLLWAAWLITEGRPRVRQSVVASIVLLLPVAVLWAAGAAFHGSITWIVSSNLAAEVLPGGTLIVLDWVGAAISRGGAGLVKGLIVAAIAASSAALAWASIRASTRAERPYAGYAAAISVAILVLCLSLNQHEIWAAVRFSRVLVLPIGWSLLIAHPVRSWAPRALRPVAAFALLASQLAYAWYMARVFAW